MAEKLEAVRIPYPKHWFAMGTIMWAVATTILVYLSSTAPTEGTRLFWAIVSAAEGVALFLFFVPPLFTSHWAGKKALRLRMGLLMDASIPYDWVKEVKQTNVNWGGVRVGIGTRYSALSKTLFVTSEFRDLVAIKLDGEHSLGRVIKVKPEQIVLSVQEPWKLMELLRDRTGLTEDR